MTQREHEGRAPREAIGPNTSPNKDVSSDNLTFPVGASIGLDDFPVQDTIVDTFGRRTWDVTEAALSVHASLLIKGANPLGLMIVGPTGVGKSTAIKLLKDCPETYRTDEVTPAAFVSHDASLSEEELQDVDLLPKIKHKTLLGSDMNSWFTGPEDEIREKMSRIARVMDGDGLARSSGAHGDRKYTGDYRFNFVGATTPLKRRAWEMMGHTGNRFVFHELPGGIPTAKVRDDVFGDDEYKQKVDNCREVVTEFVNELWNTYGGYASVRWSTTASKSIQQTITDLGELVAHARAPIEDGEPIIEGRRRIVAVLRNLARGRALLDDRVRITEADLPVVARVALSTMPRKRRGLVRALVNPGTPSFLETTQVTDILNVSEGTAHTRMQRIDTLGIGIYAEAGGPNPHAIALDEEFKWPSTVSFPDSFE